jgi:predicted O-methyltransferase YrrM
MARLRQLSLKASLGTATAFIALSLVAGGLLPQWRYWCVAAALLTSTLCLLAMAKSMIRRLNDLRRAIDRKSDGLFIGLATEQHAMTCILSRFPQCTLPTTGWSMRFSNLHQIVVLLDELRPTQIVEFGSGLSTVMMASWLREQGRGELLSFDHDADWCERTRQHLDHCDLASFASVVHAPLEMQVSGGRSKQWYGISSRELPAQPIDLVVVDGPPAGLPHLSESRAPALDALWSRLSPKAAVVLDDANRPGEKKVVETWMSQHPELNSRLVSTFSGLAILRRQASSAQNADGHPAFGDRAASEPNARPVTMGSMTS